MGGMRRSDAKNINAGTCKCLCVVCMLKFQHPADKVAYRPEYLEGSFLLSVVCILSCSTISVSLKCSEIRRKDTLVDVNVLIYSSQLRVKCL